jgi:H+/Cl- antiporter ClcA
MALYDRGRRTLIAAGAAAGLAAAFNAPLAAIIFVTEEPREHFEYSFASIQSIILDPAVERPPGASRVVP